MSPRSIVVGAGLMGQWHAHAIRKSSGRLQGVVDQDSQKARDLAEGGASWTRIEDALAEVTPDVVHVCTAADLHVDHARLALEHGCHVVVEKPVAPDVAQTEALLELAAERGLTLTPVHQMPFQPWADEVGRVGRILAIEHVLYSAGAGPGDDAQAIAESILCHPLAVFERLLPSGALEGADWSVVRTGPGEIRGLSTTAGCALQVTVSMAGRPPRNELVVSGARATLYADLFHGFGSVDAGGVGRASKVARPFARAAATIGRAGTNLGRRALAREPAFPGLGELIEQTYGAITGGGSVPLPPEHVLAVARARTSILEAP